MAIIPVWRGVQRWAHKHEVRNDVGRDGVELLVVFRGNTQGVVFRGNTQSALLHISIRPVHLISKLLWVVRSTKVFDRAILILLAISVSNA
jgi:hypothetical protein